MNEQLFGRVRRDWTGSHHLECAHYLFSKCAEQTPNRVALRFEEREITYAALDAQSDRLAHQLAAHGVTKGATVALWDISPEHYPVAVLGVHKAGAAYLAVPKNVSADHRREMSDIAGVKLSLTSTQGDIPRDLVSLSVGKLLTEPLGEPQKVVRPTSLGSVASIRFTSGSTGRPKGVLNTHHSLVARLTESPLPDLSAEDTCGLLPAIGLGSRLLLPLAIGATVVPFGGDHRNIVQLQEWLVRQGITSIYLVPPILRELIKLNKLSPEALPRLRAIAVGGDIVDEQLGAAFLEVFPDKTLVALYGSSELGTTVAMRVCTSDNPLKGTSIGRSHAGAVIYVLDQELKPVQQGDPGELVIGSPHLSLGYVGLEPHGTERYIPDPLGLHGHLRFYKTGDLARVDENGEIHFLGRLDHQVKIRANRVELEQVERALKRCSGIADCAATSFRVADDNMLVAYVVTDPSHLTTTEKLREELATILPSFAIPSRFVWLPEMPRTHSGKIDRASLPALSSDRPDLSTLMVEPTTAEEAIIQVIWESVLMVNPIGVEDHFLDLGGDSLRAIQIMARLAQTFECGNISLFDAPTIRQLAALLGPKPPRDVAHRMQDSVAVQGAI